MLSITRLSYFTFSDVAVGQKKFFSNNINRCSFSIEYRLNADQYLAEIDAFAASVTGNGPVAIPLMETRRSVAILEAARASWERRTFVSLV